MNKNKLKTNNALSYRVDLKMEVLSTETESWKRMTVIPVLIGILRTSYRNSGISVASKPSVNSYIKGWHHRKKPISSFLLFVEFSQLTICIAPKTLETRD